MIFSTQRYCILTGMGCVVSCSGVRYQGYLLSVKYIAWCSGVFCKECLTGEGVGIV